MKMIPIKVSNAYELHLYKIASGCYYFLHVNGRENRQVIPIGFPNVCSRWCDPLGYRMVKGEICVKRSALKLDLDPRYPQDIVFYKTIKVYDYVKNP